MKPTRTIRLAVAAVAVAGLLAAAAPAQSREDGVRARGLFRTGKTDAMRIVVLKSENGLQVPVDPNMEFRQGDRISISLESNFPGYLYIMNVMPTGKRRLLYPAPDENNKVAAHAPYTLGPFEFDAEKGIETVQVIVSRSPVVYLDAAKSNPKGDLEDTAASAAQELSVNIGSPSRTGVVTENVSIPQPPAGHAGIRARGGLSFAPPQEKDPEAQDTIVAIPDRSTPVGGECKDCTLKSDEAITFEIRLKHV
jgi:hypothetical protein